MIEEVSHLCCVFLGVFIGIIINNIAVSKRFKYLEGVLNALEAETATLSRLFNLDKSETIK